MARALREAHALGVVHRDVKPANVFLVRQDDDDDFVKVLDFGLVHEGKAGEAHEQPGTEPIMGSPRYMAPEQVQGKEIDARADVYSLGVVLYTMLAGRPPFERRTDLATMMAQVSDPPPPLASVAEGLVVPPALEAIVMRCLAKSPDDRWASMEELVAALAHGAPSSPRAVAAATVPKVQERRAPAPRKSGARGVTLAVFLTAAAGLAGLALHGRSSRPVAPEASGALPSAAPAPPPPPAPVAPLAKATLHVETEPPGARVTEEGETLCAATPCDVLYTGGAADPSAEHLVALLLPGYKVERKIVKGTASPLHVKLTKSDR
jgi:serine/threonine-protein kinase